MIKNSEEDWSIISSSSDYDERSSDIDEEVVIGSIDGESLGGTSDRTGSFGTEIRNINENHPHDTELEDSQTTQLIKDIDNVSLKLPNLNHGSSSQSTANPNVKPKSDLSKSDTNNVSNTTTKPKTERGIDQIINFYENFSKGNDNLNSVKDSGIKWCKSKINDIKIEEYAISIQEWIRNNDLLVYLSIIPTTIVLYYIYNWCQPSPEPNVWDYYNMQRKNLVDSLLYQETKTWYGYKLKTKRFNADHFNWNDIGLKVNHFAHTFSDHSVKFFTNMSESSAVWGAIGMHKTLRIIDVVKGYSLNYYNVVMNDGGKYSQKLLENIKVYGQSGMKEFGTSSKTLLNQATRVSRGVLESSKHHSTKFLVKSQVQSVEWFKLYGAKLFDISKSNSITWFNIIKDKFSKTSLEFLRSYDIKDLSFRIKSSLSKDWNKSKVQVTNFAIFADSYLNDKFVPAVGNVCYNSMQIANKWLHSSGKWINWEKVSVPVIKITISADSFVNDKVIPGVAKLIHNSWVTFNEWIS